MVRRPGFVNTAFIPAWLGSRRPGSRELVVLFAAIQTRNTRCNK